MTKLFNRTLQLALLAGTTISVHGAEIELYGDVTHTATGFIMESTNPGGFASVGYANTPRTSVMQMNMLTDLSANYRMLNSTQFAGGSPRFSMYFGVPGGGGEVPATYTLYIYWSNPVNTTPAPGWNNTGNAMDVDNSSVMFATDVAGYNINTYYGGASDKQSILNAIGGYHLRSLWMDLDAGWANPAGQKMEVNVFTINQNNYAVPEPASMAMLGMGALALIRRRKR
jgi:hypothetical protein